MFVPILTDMFNHWFAQGAIPGSITKGVITLLKKGGSHFWEGLDHYRPITLLNTESKILARVLANRLQIVISDQIGSEQTYAVKGRSIQDNLHLICEVLEGIEDGTETAPISLDQSKAFDRVDHRFLASVLASVLETAGFQPEFRGWISMLPCFHLSMSSLWSPYLGLGLGMREQIQPCAVSLLMALLRQGFPRCIPPPGYKVCEEGGWRVRTDNRSQGQLWQKRRFAARCLEG